jgi:DeoR family fructose operon transcriptional repressor
MTSDKLPVFVEERKQQILELLRKKKKIVVPELCVHFGVSASTIRNDLKALNDARLITRTHGGAISNSKVSHEPLPVDKQSYMNRQKKAIALQAAELVDNGDVIALCTGTTVMELARCLVHKKKLTVVVNDIGIAAGATIPDFQLAANIAEIIGLASERILLCDSSKLGTLTFSRIASMENISTIIVDGDANTQDLQELKDFVAPLVSET